MIYSIILIAFATITIAIIQILKTVILSPSYKRMSMNLTLGVVSLFAPISISLIEISIFGNRVSVNMFLVFSGIGGLLAIYFFSKAAVNT